MTITRRTFIATGASALALPAFAAQQAATDETQRVFVASYEGGGSDAGIHSFTFDPATGRMSDPKLAVRTRYPGNIYVHPSGDYLYSGSAEDAEFAGTHFVASYKVDNLDLTEINRTSAGGFRPSHGEVDKNGKFLVIPNYRSDNIVVFNLQDDGSLGRIVSHVGNPFGARTWESDDWDKPHIVHFSPDNRYVLVAEINTNRVVVYRFNETSGEITFHSAEQAGRDAGPRHVFFHPSGKYLYSANERGSSVSGFKWDAQSGKLALFQTVRSIPYGFNRSNDPSHIEVDPSGRFVYLANRGHNSIAMFSVSPTDGMLMPMGHFPLRARSWCFQIDKTGKWMLAAGNSDSSIQALKIDPVTGLLFRSGHELRITDPACIRII